MGSEIQDDFSGGMQDTDLGKGIPKNTYLFGKNLTFRGIELGIRPVISAFNIATDGNIVAVFPYGNATSGATIAEVSYVDSRILRLSYLHMYPTAAMRLFFKFPDADGFTDGFLHFSSTITGISAVFLQLGNSVYFFGTNRGLLDFAFKTTLKNASPVNYDLVPVSLVCDATGQSEWLPPACAAIFAYDRVFLGTRNDTYRDFNSVMVSKKVDAVSNPMLYFDDVRVFTGGVKTEYVLGFSDLGGGCLALFFENMVYVLRNCDGEPDGIRSELICGFGAVGRSAFCDVNGDTWFVANGGVYRIRKGGLFDPIPVTATISAWWSAHFVGSPPMVQILCDGQRVYISLPCDTYNNYEVLVYNLFLQCWEGIWNGFGVWSLALCGFESRQKRIMFISRDGIVSHVSADSGNLPTGVTSQLRTRAFRGPSSYLPDLFTRANIEVNSTGVTGTPAVAVDAVCSLTSVDQDTGVSVTHHSAVTMSGHGVHLCVICRVCQRIAVDMVFSAGLFYIRKIQLFFRGK